jgi:hypothetical protein
MYTATLTAIRLSLLSALILSQSGCATQQPSSAPQVLRDVLRPAPSAPGARPSGRNLSPAERQQLEQQNIEQMNTYNARVNQLRQPPKLEVDRENPGFILPIQQRRSLGELFEDEDGTRLSGAAKLTVALDQKGKKAFYWNCTYIIGYGNTRSVGIWADSRPELPPTTSNEFSRIQSSVTADVAANRCPDTWGQAIDTVWGPGAWTNLRTSPEFVQGLNVAAARKEALAAQRAAEWEKLSDRQKCMRRNGLQEPSESRSGRPNNLYINMVDLACGRYKN